MYVVCMYLPATYCTLCM